MAAVLACGDDAVLSHRSAAQLWGIGFEEARRIDVSIRRKSTITREGIKVRARPSLDAKSVVVRLGIPVTHPVQTLIDLATELKIMRLERAVNEADRLDLVDPEALRHALDGYVGMPGVKTLRTLLDRHTFRLSDSDLEILFRPHAGAAGPDGEARPEAHGGRATCAALHPLADRPRAERSDGRPAPGESYFLSFSPAATHNGSTSSPRPSACSCAHRPMSSDSTATASVSPIAASRSRPSAYR
jgi:hypothetical protein